MQRHRGGLVVSGFAMLGLIGVFAACGGDDDDGSAPGNSSGGDGSVAASPDGNVSSADSGNGGNTKTDGGATDSGVDAGDAHPDGAAVTTGTCLDGASERAIVTPTAGQLVITELLPNSDGDDALLEWFEIKNTGAAAFDLNGLSLARTGQAASPLSLSECKSVPAGGYAVFAHTTDDSQNGGILTVDATFSFSLLNKGDLQVLDGQTVLDAVTWASSTDGLSLQLDPDAISTTANDSASNFCNGSSSYGTSTNKGTPKADNTQCP